MLSYLRNRELGIRSRDANQALEKFLHHRFTEMIETIQKTSDTEKQRELLLSAEAFLNSMRAKQLDVTTKANTLCEIYDEMQHVLTDWRERKIKLQMAYLAPQDNPSLAYRLLADHATLPAPVLREQEMLVLMRSVTRLSSYRLYYQALAYLAQFYLRQPESSPVLLENYFRLLTNYARQGDHHLARTLHALSTDNANLVKMRTLFQVDNLTAQEATRITAALDNIADQRLFFASVNYQDAHEAYAALPKRVSWQQRLFGGIRYRTLASAENDLLGIMNIYLSNTHESNLSENDHATFVSLKDCPNKKIAARANVILTQHQANTVTPLRTAASATA